MKTYACGCCAREDSACGCGCCNGSCRCEKHGRPGTVMIVREIATRSGVSMSVRSVGEHHYNVVPGGKTTAEKVKQVLAENDISGRIFYSDSERTEVVAVMD